MTSGGLYQRARPVIAVAATLFVVDLFLGWQRVAVHMPGIDVRSTASGWSGWGALAGLCALALLALAIAGRSSPATAATLWPAWVALALAGVMAVGAAIPYLALPGGRAPATEALR
jgi:hypothetical protein